MSTTQSTEDDRWEQAYNNAAELLFPDAFDPANFRPVRTLTEDEDAACIAAANEEIREASA